MFYHVWKGVNHDENLDLFKNFFWSNQKKGTNINKNCFSAQSEPHTAKLCFSVVMKHFRGNSEVSSLFSKKMNISERWTEKLRKLVLLNMFEKRRILRKIWICLNNFFLQIIKMRKILIKTCFSYLFDPHTAKLCFSVVLKHFWRNSQRTSLFSPKSDYLRKDHWNTPKVCFNWHVWKSKSWWKFVFVLTTVYDETVNGGNINKNLFFSSKWATYNQTMLFCFF